MKQVIIFFLIIFISNSCEKNKFSVRHNVPEKQNFEKEITFELNQKFSKQNGKNLKINWELLADTPVEKQNSYPEYFVWVKMSENNKIVNQGLTKLIVKDKKFHSISFMNDERIKAVPYDAQREFPSEILKKIKNK